MMQDVIFKEYDIRGVYNEQYDVKFAEELGRAYVRFTQKALGKKDLCITLGMDARESSPEIIESLAIGLKKSGAKVIKLGLVTTPISYFSTFHMQGVDGAIMVTGSHNPPEYNGFKISVGKTTIMGADIQTLKEIIKNQDYVEGEGSIEEYDIFPDYVARYKEEFQDLSGVKVVLDCGNGVAGSIVRRLYEAVGLQPVILFEEPDGRFPNHHPDPTVEKNMEDLKIAVKNEGAAIGIGFDGDADRIGIISNEGRFILGDELMAFYADDVLKQKPGATIIADVKCSDRLYQYIEKRGGNAIMWNTGHSLIKKKVKSEKSPFGGELSCHIFFADRNYGYDDSLYAGLRLIEILRKSGKTFEEHLQDFPQAYSTPEIRIDTSEEKKLQIVAKMKDYYQNANCTKLVTIDGIRASFEDGWALVRASNTQPVLSMRFEASNQAALERIQNEAMSIIEKFL